QPRVVARREAPDLDKGVVHDFFGQFPSFQDAHGNADHLSGLAVINHAQSGTVAAPAGGKKLSIIVPVCRHESSTHPARPSPPTNLCNPVSRMRASAVRNRHRCENTAGTRLDASFQEYFRRLHPAVSFPCFSLEGSIRALG